jgi:hypothetical protein
MARYAIWAFENTYGGLHGIERHIIIEDDPEHPYTIEDLETEASEYSREIIEDFNTISDEIEEWVNSEDYDEEEYDEVYEEMIGENIGYCIYKIVKGEDKTVEELQDMFFNYREEFVRDYCEQELV